MRTLNRITLIGRCSEPHQEASRLLLFVTTQRGGVEGNVCEDMHKVVVASKDRDYVLRYIWKGTLVSVEGEVNYANGDGATIQADRIGILHGARQAPGGAS